MKTFVDQNGYENLDNLPQIETLLTEKELTTILI